MISCTTTTTLRKSCRESLLVPEGFSDVGFAVPDSCLELAHTAPLRRRVEKETMPRQYFASVNYFHHSSIDFIGKGTLSLKLNVF